MYRTFTATPAPAQIQTPALCPQKLVGNNNLCRSIFISWSASSPRWCNCNVFQLFHQRLHLSFNPSSTAMNAIRWFYHVFGLASIHETGRNAYLIILARTCRMFAYGTNSLILGKKMTLWSSHVMSVDSDLIDYRSQPSSSPHSASQILRSVCSWPWHSWEMSFSEPYLPSWRTASGGGGCCWLGRYSW
jgi:hypothetical protein